MAAIKTHRECDAIAVSDRAQEALRRIALLLFCCGIVGNAAAADFVSTGYMTTARSYHTATPLSGGKVLVAGGNPGTGGYLSTAELYDPASGSFAATGSMTAPRYYHTATRLADGRVLVAGGFNSTGSVASADLYDPATGGFAAAGSMTTSRHFHTATLLADGKVLVAGGYTSSGATGVASAELYDPATGSFTATGSMTSARFRHTAVPLPDGKVLLAGGFSSAGSLASAELYDPATGSFSATGSMTVSRYMATATSLPNGKVLIAGGIGGGASQSSTELYDPSTGSFSATGRMAETRYLHTATSLPGGRVLVAGGRGAFGNLASAEIYDPATGSFAAAGSMTAGRMGHAAARLADGRVLISGGTALASAEIYSPIFPPVSDAGPDQNIYLGRTATLSGTSSYDPGGAALTYTWALDAKPSGSTATLSPTTGSTATLLPDVVGQYVISLVVSNGTQNSLADTVLVNVTQNLPPAAVASAAPVSGDAPLVVLFNAGASSDPEGGPLAYSWDFGDSSPADQFANPNHTYTIPGSYTAVLTVTDDFGNTEQASVAITVTAPNTPPTVGPTATPSSGTAPFAVQFTANALDPEGAVLSYAWDFGDGSPVSNLANPSHSYASPGVYTPRLTVSDGAFAVTGTATVSVSSALAVGVTQARVKFGRPGKVDDKAYLKAKFTYPGTPSGVVKVVFDGITLLEVPFASFRPDEPRVYVYQARNVHAKIDLNRRTFKLSRHKMLLAGIDNGNGVDVVIRFGASVATDHFVMREHGHQGERALYYESKKDGHDHGDSQSDKGKDKKKGHNGSERSHRSR